MSSGRVHRSRQLSWLLRHGAGEAGLAMDAAGWASVEDVRQVLGLTADHLLEAVATNDKGRLELDGGRIRACQGHSIATMPVTAVALEATWRRVHPPDLLWHGTRLDATAGIAERGIEARGRTHVHLAPTTTSTVGKRARVEVLLGVDPRRLEAGGVAVFEAPNGVLLVRHVPPWTITTVVAGSGDDDVAAAARRALGLATGPTD